MIKKAKLPTILGIIILIIGTFAGVFVLNLKQVFRIGASPLNSPKDVRITNITNNSATISFLTDSDAATFLTWSDTESNLNKIEKEDANDTKFKSHSINLSGLSANKQYFFKINSEGTEYDNNSLAWKFTTGPDLGAEQFSIPISGTVITATGNPVKRAIVYLNISGYMLSTLTSDAGSYVFQLGTVRSSDFKKYLFIDEASVLTDALLEFSIQADSNSVASAQINLLSSESVPPIVMGQTQDFRNQNNSGSSQNPNALLNLPATSTDQSKFQVATTGTPPPPTSVILESIKDGEVISTDKPQFFGKGPQGQNLTIQIHSDQVVTGSVVVPKTGSWSYTVPSNLTPGNHTITVSWVDTTGITRSLTRSFIVQAAEVPAFTASGSGSVATPTPSPTIAPTSGPVVSPTPTSIPTATPIASIVPTESPVPVPVTGDLTPTLFLFIMSIGVLIFSFGIWKISENA